MRKPITRFNCIAFYLIGVVLGWHETTGIMTATPREALDLSTEWLTSRDLTLSGGTLTYRQTQDQSEWLVGVNHGLIEIDFASPDIFTQPTQVKESSIGGSVDLRHPLTNKIKGELNLNGYEGFANYTSAWLHEFYQQRYGTFGYQAVTPHGLQGSLGFRWEYLPGSAWLRVTGIRSRQRIAPGAEFDGTLTLGNQRITSNSLLISTENILTSRVRSQLDLNLIRTTDRRSRIAWRGHLHYAPADDWVIRSTLGWTKESPNLEAYLASSSVDYEVSPALILSLSGRFYRDTGEIENSTLFSTAAPGVNSWSAGLGIRYLWGHSSLKFFLGPYWSRYAPIGRGTEFFGQLYQDREFILVQAAYSWEF